VLRILRNTGGKWGLRVLIKLVDVLDFVEGSGSCIGTVKHGFLSGKKEAS